MPHAEILRGTYRAFENICQARDGPIATRRIRPRVWLAAAALLSSLSPDMAARDSPAWRFLQSSTKRFRQRSRSLFSGRPTPEGTAPIPTISDGVTEALDEPAARSSNSSNPALDVVPLATSAGRGVSSAGRRRGRVRSQSGDDSSSEDRGRCSPHLTVSDTAI